MWVHLSMGKSVTAYNFPDESCRLFSTTRDYDFHAALTKLQNRECDMDGKHNERNKSLPG